MGEEHLWLCWPALAGLLEPLVEVELQGLADRVEVDLGEHVVARHDQGLERVDATLVDAETPFSGLWILERQDGVEEPG